MQINGLRFVDTDGGPLIVIPHRVLQQWNGIDPPRDGRTINVPRQFDRTQPATDYDRACNAPSPVSTIDVGGVGALVLGSYVDNAAWHPLTRGTGVGAFVRVESVDDKKSVLPMLDRADFEGETIAVDEWRIDDRLRLFDATADGSDMGTEGIDIEVPVGTYAVHTWRHFEPGIARVVVHRLIRR
jgi:hypothetical protein